MTVAGLSFRVDGQRDPVELDVRVSEGVWSSDCGSVL